MLRSPIIKNKFLQIPDYQKEKEKKLKKTSIEKYNVTNYARYVNFNPHNTNREKIEYPELQLSIKKCIYQFEKKKKLNLTKSNLTFPKILKTSLPKIMRKINYHLQKINIHQEIKRYLIIQEKKIHIKILKIIILF